MKKSGICFIIVLFMISLLLTGCHVSDSDQDAPNNIQNTDNSNNIDSNIIENKQHTTEQTADIDDSDKKDSEEDPVKSNDDSTDNNENNDDAGKNTTVDDNDEKNLAEDDISDSTDILRFTLLNDDTYSVEETTDLAATNIKIPSVYNGKSVTNIGEYAFMGKSSLKNIIIPDSVTDVGDYAFYGCSNLVSVTIGDGVTSIGEMAFYSCSNLISITIPKDVTIIGVQAFSGCSKLIEVINHSELAITIGSEYYGGVARYAKEVHTGTSKIINQNNYLFYTYQGSDYLMGYTGNETVLILPETYQGGTYAIHDRAFENCSAITAVTISDGVTAIGKNAFYGCRKLQSVTIGSGVIEIGRYAFSSTGLKSVIFSETSGWKAYDVIPSEALADRSTAALYVREQYANSRWIRE